MTLVMMLIILIGGILEMSVKAQQSFIRLKSKLLLVALIFRLKVTFVSSKLESIVFRSGKNHSQYQLTERKRVR